MTVSPSPGQPPAPAQQSAAAPIESQADDERRHRIDVLQREAQYLDTQARAEMARIYQYGGVAFGALGVVAPLLAKPGHYGVLLALPIVCAGIWLTGIRALAEFFCLTGQRQGVQEQIHRLREEYVPWDAAGGRVAYYAVANLTTFAFFAFAGLAIGSGSLIAGYGHTSTLLFAGDTAAFVILALLAGWSAWNASLLAARAKAAYGAVSLGAPLNPPASPRPGGFQRWLQQSIYP